MRHALTLVALVLIAAIPAAAQVVVAPSALNGWYTQSGTCGTLNTATTSFVEGPGTPPSGTGSVQVNIGADSGSYIGYRTNQYDGTLLSAISSLSYSTYVQTGDGVTAPYMTLAVDTNNDGAWDDTLYFEPEYQHGYTSNVPDQGDLVAGTWQTWNAMTGGWWSANGVAGTGLAGADVQPLSVIIAAYGGTPRLTVDPGYGSLRILTGCAAGSAVNWVGNFDAVNFNGTVFDFEAQAPAPPVAATQVPTLSQWALIALGVALLGVASLKLA